jgi:hypothetical protein
MMISEKKLKVIAIRNGISDDYEVSDVYEAVKLINDMASADLKNQSIVWNVFDLEIWDEEYDDWVTYYDDEGYCITEIINGDNKEEENETNN